ncbi:MAG: NAD(P)H-dependent oxidoreductase subunit E [Elusimicrobiota bacterium]
MNLQALPKIIKKHSDRRGGLIGLLQDIQEEYGYLPEPALREVAAKTGRPLIDIYGVSTFYRCFSLTPRGKHLVSVCLGTACHVRGGAQVAAEFERRLGVRPGETTKDDEFTFETVNCLGCCATGPVVVIDGKYHGQVSVRDVAALIKGKGPDAAKPGRHGGKHSEERNHG